VISPTWRPLCQELSLLHWDFCVKSYLTYTDTSKSELSLLHWHFCIRVLSPTLILLNQSDLSYTDTSASRVICPTLTLLHQSSLSYIDTSAQRSVLHSHFCVKSDLSYTDTSASRAICPALTLLHRSYLPREAALTESGWDWAAVSCRAILSGIMTSSYTDQKTCVNDHGIQLSQISFYMDHKTYMKSQKYRVIKHKILHRPENISELKKTSCHTYQSWKDWKLN